MIYPFNMGIHCTTVWAHSWPNFEPHDSFYSQIEFHLSRVSFAVQHIGGAMYDILVGCYQAISQLKQSPNQRPFSHFQVANGVSESAMVTQLASYQVNILYSKK